MTLASRIACLGLFPLLAGSFAGLAACSGGPSADGPNGTGTNSNTPLPDGGDPAGGEGEAPGTAGDGGGADAGPPPCAAVGFEGDATMFGLPSAYKTAVSASPPYRRTNATVGLCSTTDNTPTFNLLDLTGDGRPDIVVTETCDGTDKVGSTSWLVYPAGDKGFAETPLTFALPPGYGSTASFYWPFTKIASAASCSNKVPSYLVMDLTGDGKPDLVVLYDCDDALLGTTMWRVHENTGTGFAPTAKSFALPSRYSPGFGRGPLFTATAGYSYCSDGANAPTFSLMDMDGDRKPDMVVTINCTEPTLGRTTWQVHRNTGTGFADTPTVFGLPPGYPTALTESPTFQALSGQKYCSATSKVPSYVLTDMDGNGTPDLVVTEDCSDPTVGHTTWLAYANSGSGFAPTPTKFALPPGFKTAIGTPPPFARTSATPSCTSDGSNPPTFSLLDITGDARPDIVVTTTCKDAIIGDKTWQVFANSASSFAQTAVSFPLPPGYAAKVGTPRPFKLTTGDERCTDGNDVPAFVLTDIDGDGKSDVVVTRDCGDATTGRASWRVHRGVCAK